MTDCEGGARFRLLKSLMGDAVGQAELSGGVAGDVDGEVGGGGREDADLEDAINSVDRSSTKGSDTPSFICGPFGSSSSDDRKPTFSDDGGWVRPGRDCCIGRHQCTSSDVDPVKSDAHGHLAKRVLHVFIDSRILRDHALVLQVAGSDHDVIAHPVEDCLRSFLPDELHILICKTARLISHQLRCGRQTQRL